MYRLEPSHDLGGEIRADLVLLAEVAYWWAPKAFDGKLLALAGDAVPNEHFAARLIAAVLTMAGPRFQSADHISRH
jgi:hypothetical protein